MAACATNHKIPSPLLNPRATPLSERDGLPLSCMKTNHASRLRRRRPARLDGSRVHRQCAPHSKRPNKHGATLHTHISTAVGNRPAPQQSHTALPTSLPRRGLAARLLARTHRRRAPAAQSTRRLPRLAPASIYAGARTRAQRGSSAAHPRSACDAARVKRVFSRCLSGCTRPAIKGDLRSSRCAAGSAHGGRVRQGSRAVARRPVFEKNSLVLDTPERSRGLPGAPPPRIRAGVDTNKGCALRWHLAWR